MNKKLIVQIRNLYLLLFALFLSLCLSTVSAQQNSGLTVSGKVIDAAGMPIIGASVIVKGTTIGTSTNSNGAYSLQIPPPTHLKMPYW